MQTSESDTTEEPRAAWNKERRGGIGGSEAGAVLGLSPWQTPVQVWLRKTGRATSQPTSEAMRLGTALEDYVAKRYCEETGRRVQRLNKMLHNGCLLGNIDRLVIPEGKFRCYHKGTVATDRILECKTSSVEWTDGVPLYYQLQVQHYMGLCPSVKVADVPVLFVNHKQFRIFSVDRDDKVITELQARLRAWWEEYVVGDKMPPPVNEEDCKLLWKRSTAVTVEASEEVSNAVQELKETKAKIKELEDKAKTLTDTVCCAFGEADTLVQDGITLATWKSNKDSSKVDWKEIALELKPTEELIGKYTTTKPGARVLRLK